MVSLSHAREPEPLLFEEIYRLYRDDVYRFCLLQTGHPELAEDLAADALLAAYRAYDHADVPPERARVWLFRIARNLIIDHWRREKRRGRLLQIIGQRNRDVVDVE